MDERKLLIIIGIISFAGLIALLLQPIFISNRESNIAGVAYNSPLIKEQTTNSEINTIIIPMETLNKSQKELINQLIEDVNISPKDKDNYLMRFID